MRSSVATLVCVLGLVALAVSIPILPVSHEEPAHHVEVEHEEEPALDHLDVDAPRFEEDEEANEEVKQPAHVAASAQPVEDEEDQEDQEDEQEDERQAAAHERFMEEHLTNSTAGNSSNPANHTAPVNSTKAPTPVRVTTAPTVAPSTVRPSVTNAPSPQVGLQQTVTDQAVQTTGLSTALPTDGELWAFDDGVLFVVCMCVCSGTWCVFSLTLRFGCSMLEVDCFQLNVQETRWPRGSVLILC